MFVAVLIAVELNPIAFTNTLEVERSLVTTNDATWVDADPTGRFGLTFKSIKSPTNKLWEVDIESVVLILDTSPRTWLYDDSNKNRSSASPPPWKINSSELMLVSNPTRSFPLFIAKRLDGRPPAIISTPFVEIAILAAYGV